MEDEINLRTIHMKMANQIKNSRGRIRLLSEISLDEDEIEFIRGRQDEIIDEILEMLSLYSLPKCYLLIDIGMREYYGGDFWSSIVNDPNKQRRIGMFFIKTMKNYGLAVLDNESLKYKNNILMHSFIPVNYAPAFYNFVYKFYVIILNRRTSDIESKLGIIADVFGGDYAENYPALKNMNLITSTKKALADVNLFGHIVTNIIRRLANDYDSIDDVRLGVFEESFREWYHELNSDKGRKSDMSVNERPYLHYQMDSYYPSVKLIIPPRIVQSRNPSVRLVDSSGNDIIADVPISVSKQFDRYVTETKMIDISNPLEKFSLVIDGKIIHVNENRGHILLNKNGRQRNRVSLGFNMVIVPKGTTISPDSSNVGEFSDFDILGYMVQNGGHLSVQGYNYAVETEVSDNIHIVSERVDALCRDDDNSYHLYARHPTIRIDRNSPERTRFSLSIAHHGYRLSFRNVAEVENCPASIIDGNNILLDLSKTGLPAESGFYVIRFMNRVYRYLLIDGFSFSFDKDLYCHEETGSLTCSILDEPIVFETRNGIVTLPEQPIDGRNIFLSIQIPSHRYSFDREKWTMFDSEDIYFRDITSEEVYIYCPQLVFPRISVDYVGAKPIDLPIQGSNLVGQLKRIRMIGYQLNKGDLCIPALQFYCGRFKLFRIRYTADYRVVGRTILRSNAPPNTRAELRFNDICIPFNGDSLDVPEDIIGSIEVYEYHRDDFFQTESEGMLALRTEIGFRIDVDEVAILKGVEPDRIHVINNGHGFDVDPSMFAHIISISGRLDKDDVEFRTASYDSLNVSNPKEIGRRIEGEIQRMILSDDDVRRLKSRVERFRILYPEFAVRLCERILELTDDSAIRYTKQYIEGLVKKEDHGGSF